MFKTSPAATALVSALIAKYHNTDERFVDADARPLLAQLLADGLITEFAFVEFQGLYEFGLACICYSETDDLDAPENWVQIDRYGNIESLQ